MTNLIFYISPHFLVKYYLLKDLQKIAKKYSIKGSVIDIGCGSMPYKKIFSNANKYTGIDFRSYSKNSTFLKYKPDIYFPSFYAKTLNLPFKSNSFDAALSFQVLEHHKNPEKLIHECIRITRKNGLIILSFPFIWGLHEEPNDYYRLTEYMLAEFAKKHGVKILEIMRQGSVLSTINSLQNDYLLNFANKNSFNFLISIVIYPLFLLSSYSCLFLDKIFKSNQIFLNYIVVLKINK